MGAGGECSVLMTSDVHSLCSLVSPVVNLYVNLLS